MSDKDKTCIYCERSDDQIPLLKFAFKGNKYNICPEHLPLLIHQPAKLVGKLPGAESWAAAPTDQ